MEIFLDEFAEPKFIELNRPYFDRYVDMRVRGYSSHQAFLRVFGPDNWPDQMRGYSRLEAIESTDYYQERFELILKAIPYAELWNTKTAINQLLCTVRNQMAKDSVRLNAAKELNILCGIVVVDENGKTKAGRSLEDFYAKEGKQGSPVGTVPSVAALADPKHPSNPEAQ